MTADATIEYRSISTVGGERSRNVSGYAAFLLLTIVLFLRPSDMFDALENVEFYRVGLLLCLVLLGAACWRQLRFASLHRHPITVCVLGIFGVSVLSNVIHGQFDDVVSTASDGLSFLLFYLFMLGCIDSGKRYRQYLVLLAVLTVAVCGLGVLQYHGLVDVNAAPYREVQDQIDPNTGKSVVLARLCGFGIFNNPNDLARVVVVGMMLCLYFLADRKWGALRFLWALPIIMLAYALELTASRGGFLAMMSGIATLLVARYGKMKSLVAAAILVPIFLTVFGGRITDIDTSEGTGQQRIQLWRDGFEDMRDSPVFGIGVGTFDQSTGYLVHNSFIQCYVETGLVGGSLFAGAFFLSVWGPQRARRYFDRLRDPELRRFQPYLLGILIGSIVGMFSSTRNMRVDTYILLGLSVIYLDLVAETIPAVVIRFNRSLVYRLALLGVVTLVVFNVYVRWAARSA